MFLSNNDNFSFIGSLWFPIDMFHLEKIEFLLAHCREQSFLSQYKNFFYQAVAYPVYRFYISVYTRPEFKLCKI